MYTIRTYLVNFEHPPIVSVSDILYCGNGQSTYDDLRESSWDVSDNKFAS